MASRKQRRRRQKERRHDYEYVYVDDEGKEVEVDSAELEKPARRDARSSNGKRETKRKDGRRVRKVDPPSWNRVARRALIFAPLIFLAFSLLSRKQAIGTRVFVTALYTGFFIPFMYLMDRAMYRTYLKRTGQGQQPARPGRRR
ncbi:MAG: hypothetical protein WBB76_02190 [Gaiellaceae bacterium]